MKYFGIVGRKDFGNVGNVEMNEGLNYAIGVREVVSLQSRSNLTVARMAKAQIHWISNYNDIPVFTSHSLHLFWLTRWELLWERSWVDTINVLNSLNNSTAPVLAPATSRVNYCTYSKFIHIFSRDIHNFQSIIAIVHGRTSLHYALHYALHASKPNFVIYRNRRRSSSIATRGRKQHRRSTVSVCDY